MAYDFWKPVKISEEGAEAIRDMIRKRNAVIKARQNAFLYTKSTFDERKSLFQRLEDLEKSYDKINSRLSNLESDNDVQRYIQLFDFYTKLLNVDFDLNEISNIEGLFYEVSLLLDKDNVIEYVYLKSELDSIEKELFDVRGKVTKRLTERKRDLLCPHPLYAAIEVQAYCVLCHKKLKFHHDDFKYLDDLIKSKRLIADVDYHVASYGSGVDDVFYELKEIVPFDDISSYYREMYDKRHELSLQGIINDEYPFEDYVWDHFCLEKKPNVHQYRKNFPF